jgi:hypothetical protein
VPLCQPRAAAALGLTGAGGEDQAHFRQSPEILQENSRSSSSLSSLLPVDVRNHGSATPPAVLTKSPMRKVILIITAALTPTNISGPTGR